MLEYSAAQQQCPQLVLRLCCVTASPPRDLPDSRVAGRAGFELARLSAFSRQKVQNPLPGADVILSHAAAMAGKNADKSPKVEKSVKKDKSEKKSKKEKKSTGEKQDKAANAAVSLLADKKAVNPALSSLFAAQVSLKSSLYV